MEEENGKPGFWTVVTARLQYFLDKSSPHYGYRWLGFAALFLIYFLRVYLLNGWFIVTYGLGIYMLNNLIGFLSPQADPEFDLDGGLPVAEKEEFRPFARRVPEFKFWFSCTKAVLTAFGMTFFSIFDVPVFWPILLMYFIILLVVTMKKQIKHMIKHRYVPWSWGKTKYTGKAPSKESK